MKAHIFGIDDNGDQREVKVSTDGHIQMDIDNVTVNGSMTDAELRASPVATRESQFSTGGQGNKAVTTAGTPLALAASTVCTGVWITARIGNTKEIAWGFSNAVRATAGSEIGAQLKPGETILVKISNLDLIFIDAQVNGEGVSYTYTTN